MIFIETIRKLIYENVNYFSRPLNYILAVVSVLLNFQLELLLIVLRKKELVCISISKFKRVEKINAYKNVCECVYETISMKISTKIVGIS